MNPNLLLAGALIAAAFASMASGQAGGDPDGSGGTSNGTSPRPAPRLTVDPRLGVNSGKPDLGGKGFWDIPHVTDMSKACGGVTKATNVPFKTEAKKLFDARVETLSKDDPEGHSLPPGVPRRMFTPHPMEIVQLADRIVILYGRQHAKDPIPPISATRSDIGKETRLWWTSWDLMIKPGWSRRGIRTAKNFT